MFSVLRVLTDLYSNVTTSQGRDASFACSVRNLGGHKVTIGNSAPLKSYHKKGLQRKEYIFSLNLPSIVTFNNYREILLKIGIFVLENY